MLSTKKYFKN